MNKTELFCPSCNHQIPAYENVAGLTLICPECKTPYVAPDFIPKPTRDDDSRSSDEMESENSTSTLFFVIAGAIMALCFIAGIATSSDPMLITLRTDGRMEMQSGGPWWCFFERGIFGDISGRISLDRYGHPPQMRITFDPSNPTPFMIVIVFVGIGAFLRRGNKYGDSQDMNYLVEVYGERSGPHSVANLLIMRQQGLLPDESRIIRSDENWTNATTLSDSPILLRKLHHLRSIWGSTIKLPPVSLGS